MRRIACLITICLVSSLYAAHLESDIDGSDKIQRVPQLSRIIRPAPDPGDPVKTLIRELEVGRPSTYRGLTIFPLLRASSGSSGIHTLDEALCRDWITIREKDSAAVSGVLVRNDSRWNVFLIAGEIITGGKQNRIIKSDVLLPPRSDFVTVPVYCGEKERWAGPRETFKSGESLTNQCLRRMASKSESQGAIWSEIDDQMEQAKVASPTRSYQGLYEDAAVSRELKACVSHFRKFCRRDTLGAVVVSRGRILGADIFSDGRLFSRLWDKICRSYAMDTVLKDAPGRERRKSIVMGRSEIKRFLHRILSARFTVRHTPGAGQLLDISGSVDGDALVLRDTVVHTAVFPGSVVYLPERRR